MLWPVPKNLLVVLKEISQNREAVAAIFMALSDEAFAGVRALIGIGRELVNAPDYPIVVDDFLSELDHAKSVVESRPHFHRAELAGNLQLSRYISEALDAAEAAGIHFIPLDGYWQSSTEEGPLSSSSVKFPRRAVFTRAGRRMRL